MGRGRSEQSFCGGAGTRRHHPLSHPYRRLGNDDARAVGTQAPRPAQHWRFSAVEEARGLSEEFRLAPAISEGERYEIGRGWPRILGIMELAIGIVLAQLGYKLTFRDLSSLYAALDEPRMTVLV